jgi:DNA sulfur modification protein DndD
MIFESLILENFGIYKGRHEVDLDSPDHTKPIILFGALNGGGKTTFLDALQLALYGKHAKCSNRGRLSYAAYLEQTINRYAPEKQTSITLRFRHDVSGQRHTYEINRAWEKHDRKECKEAINVSHNGHPDALLSEHWDDFVNDFIPQSLSELFFFDGEKIENLADPARAAELVRTGIEALLGLELLAQLSVDLSVMKKRIQENLLDEKQSELLQTAQERVSALKTARTELNKSFAQVLETLQDQQAEVDYLRQQLSDNGAHLLKTKDQVNREEATIKAQLDSINGELIRLAAGALPLKLVSDLIEQTKKQLHKEAEIKNYHTARTLLVSQEEKILARLSQDVAHTKLTEVKAQLMAEREQQDQLYAEPCYLNCDPSIFNGLDERIAQEEQQAKALLQQKNELTNKLELVQRKLQTIPDFDAVKGIIEKAATSEAALLQAEQNRSDLLEQAQHLESDIQQAEAQLNAILVQGNAQNFEQQRQLQVANHSERLQSIIDEFKGELIKENIQRLQQRIKSKFDTIKRKESLISEIRIDSETFILTLFAQDLRPISPTRLSAGERQLLAIAVLWGLADESGKELPTIIDTPMGRLDGKHRSRLIEHYFPMAAAQVILLSTDEEIQGHYYKKLKPYIAKEYHIAYDEAECSSFIQPGYFPENPA